MRVDRVRDALVFFRLMPLWAEDHCCESPLLHSIITTGLLALNIKRVRTLQMIGQWKKDVLTVFAIQTKSRIQTWVRDYDFRRSRENHNVPYLCSGVVAISSVKKKIPLIETRHIFIFVQLTTSRRPIMKFGVFHVQAFRGRSIRNSESVSFGSDICDASNNEREGELCGTSSLLEQRCTLTVGTWKGR